MARQLGPAYRGSAATFFTALSTPASEMEKAFTAALAEATKRETGRPAGKSQLRAWTNSLSALARDLNDAGLDRIEVMVEFPMPHNRKSAADVVLAGVNRHTSKDLFVVIELKQWSEAELYEEDEKLVVVPGSWNDYDTHPATQVSNYCQQLAENCSALDGEPEAIEGVAYLHNATRKSVPGLFDLALDSNVRLFTKTERSAFVGYLRDRFENAEGHPAAERLVNGRVQPNQPLLEKAANVLKGRDKFILVDQQQKAFETVRHAVEGAFAANTKRVVTITGGPGSGKTAVAIELLHYMASAKHRTWYATGSRAFTETMRRFVTGSDKDLRNLFKYFNDFATAGPNEADILIADEAHRARLKSFDRFNPKKRSDRPQIQDLINAARVPVFFLDEHQVVKPGEVGTLAAIKSYAQQLNVRHHHISLEGQWRCGGSVAYDLWVRRLLALGDEDGEWDGDAGPQPWTGDENFEVIVAESPADMESTLAAKLSEGWTARMTAGFCWPWSKPNPDKTLEPDVKIGDWERPWNANSPSKVGDAPPSQIWASAPGGFGQIGCVYTAQGLEFDWAGVIIGPDLLARGGRLITEREGCKDRDLTKSSVTHEQFDRLIRNTYKVLLTRGLTGMVLYSTDPETQEFLSGLVNGSGT
ncbi:DUF2075 domain-containing protein [Streptosporangium sp. NBC_01495]|uniref:DUF2075 domain-containing protein n=1 Tax=Streptosporangium sp. NBC_01495 TaxID=2903899 RepID=UPI002E36CCCB|nr:DUF2075 domain-containing protein [Streptosporangium sp. NBC_01495]